MDSLIRKTRVLILFLFFFSCSILVDAQEDSTKAEGKSVIVLPFLKQEKFPYPNDLLREFLIREFYAKGFTVHLDEQTWNKLLEMDIDLTEVGPAEADSIASKINIDLLVYGDISNSAKIRYSLSGTDYSPTPFLIKVFDLRKKEIIVSERINLQARWGLIRQQGDLSTLAAKIVNFVRQQGY